MADPHAGPPERTEVGELRAPGPWGQLELSSTVISPPLELIPDDPDPVPDRSSWCFPEATPESLGQWLTDVGFPAEEIPPTLATARPVPRVSGVVVSVAPATVRRLSPDTRARIYSRLAHSELNPRQQNAPRFYGTAEEWIGAGELSPRALLLVRTLVYSSGGFQLFADIDLVRAELSDPRELRLVAKKLLREKTLLAKVRVPDASRLESMIEYWGRGGRMTDIRPVLESLADLGPGASLDVLHLLPEFVRVHLYRYPRLSLADLEKPALPNCFWTALNFFALESYDDRFLKLDLAMSSLARDYYVVHDDLMLGDVVLLSTREGLPYHAAVYVADGIVFGKNGTSSVAPWTLLPLERLPGYFPQHAEGGRITYYRRKDL